MISKGFPIMAFFLLICLPCVSALSIVVHIPEKYTDMESGDRIYFEIEIKYPENPERKDLRLNYDILDSEGYVILHSKVLKAVETQASFIDFMVIPESVEPGLYSIRVNIADYEDLSEEVEASFYVISSRSDDIKPYFFIIMGIVLFIAIISIFEFMRLSKMKKEMERKR